MGALLNETKDPLEPRLDQGDDDGPRRRPGRLALAWGLVLAWAAVIWLLGSSSFSSAATSPDLLDWLSWLVSDLDYRARYRLLMGIRKSAHFVEYAILAVLTFRAALLSAPRNPITTAVWVALFIVASLASADEARQAFSPDRTGSPYDVLIDLAGGVIAILGVVVITRRLHPRRAAARSSA